MHAAIAFVIHIRRFFAPTSKSAIGKADKRSEFSCQPWAVARTNCKLRTPTAPLSTMFKPASRNTAIMSLRSTWPRR